MDARIAVSDVLSRMAFAREVLDGASQQARAYASAARTIRTLAGALRAMYESGELSRVRGVGPATLRVVADVVAGREPAELTELEAKIPAGLFEIHRIKGLGPAKIRKLWQGLSITSLGELEHACRENRLVLLEGFGAKTQANVLAAIEQMHRSDRVLLRGRAAALALPVLATLRARGASAEIIGELRRGAELIERLGVVVAGEREAIASALAAHGVVAGKVDGARFEVIEVEPARLGAAAVISTASAEHIDKLAARAEERGLELRSDGLFRGGALVSCEHEDDLYEALDLAPNPPEQREPESPLVARGRARPKLIERADLRGALHNHTVASDGSATLEEMRAAAAAFGLSYLGISEHSVSAAYAGGLSVEALRAQARSLAEMNERGDGCVLLSGIESDILADGSLDYPDEILSELEVVIASVHRRHGLDRAASTARMVAAAGHPLTDVLGHPTGRLLLGRPPNDFDVGAMLDEAARSGCAVELNSSPHRLDLDWRALAQAKERGVMISIAADAHATAEIGYLEHGIAVARRAGLTAEDVLNARSLSELRQWLRDRRARRGVALAS